MFDITSQKDIETFKISTRLLMDVALKKGYELAYFPSGPATGSGITRCRKNNKEFFFKSTCAALTPSYGVAAAENKILTNSILKGNQINTPEIVVIRSDEPISVAYAFLEKYHKVVVKPSNMNHGDGITVGITNKQQLEKAVELARSLGGVESDTIVQQQVMGKEYRFLVVNHKVVAVAHRKPPFVVGDGTSTIEQLIAQKNLDPRRMEGHASILTRISTDDVLLHKGADFLAMVPAMRQEVDVLETSNLSRGGESVDFTDTASTALKKMAVKAAESTFLGIAGVDIMTDNIAGDDLTNSFVIEVNLSPGIRMHQYPSQGKPINVARIIFTAIERTARPIGKNISHLGRSEDIRLPEISDVAISARIDTGAKTSALSISKVRVEHDGLHVIFFNKNDSGYNGKEHVFKTYDTTVVASSNGQVEERYRIKLKCKIKSRVINTSFTLTDRSSQVYPILIGRNILRGKFIVNVEAGKPLVKKEKMRTHELRNILKNQKEKQV